MAIYCRWGEIRIIANLGEQIADYLYTPETLLEVEWADGTGHTFYQWANFLRADNGFDELAHEIELAPKKDVFGEDLAYAIERAE